MTVPKVRSTKSKNTGKKSLKCSLKQIVCKSRSPLTMYLVIRHVAFTHLDLCDFFEVLLKVLRNHHYIFKKKFFFKQNILMAHHLYKWDIYFRIVRKDTFLIMEKPYVFLFHRRFIN